MHPESVIQRPDRQVQLKVHSCMWSGEYPENSLAAIRECYEARVARVEIDVCMLADADFLVVHDLHLDDSTTGRGLVRGLTREAARSLRILHRGGASRERPPLLSEVVDLIRHQPRPGLMELDLKERQSMPWSRVEELARLLEPVRDRVTVAGPADWNLRRLLRIDPSLPVGWDPAAHFDWVPFGKESESEGLSRGAYGYLDVHPLARARSTPVAEYIHDRFAELLLLVPGMREMHLRLNTFERIIDDGVRDLVDILHARGILLDVWTLDADTPRWRERLDRALEAGADIITSNTPRALAAAARHG